MFAGSTPAIRGLSEDTVSDTVHQKNSHPCASNIGCRIAGGGRVGADGENWSLSEFDIPTADSDLWGPKEGVVRCS